MIDFIKKSRYDCGDLIRLVALLRAPGGCPWDIAQTHTSIRRNFLEEAYEVCEAIDDGDSAHLREELGDVLLQVVFHAGIEQDAGHFDFDDVCNAVCQKLIARHPHLFSDAAERPDWETLKRAQRGNQTVQDAMRGVCKALPSLWRADKLLSKAEKSCADRNSPPQTVEQLSLEIAALREAIASAAEPSAAYGRMLFTAVKLARSLGIDPEDALHSACNNFIDSFSMAEPSDPIIT